MLFLILHLYYIYINSNNIDDYKIYRINKQSDSDVDKINILSIIYELFFDHPPILKIKIKTANKILLKIHFKALLKSEDEFDQIVLNCFNELEDLIVCFSNNNISFDIEKKYYFYYKKESSGIILTLNGKDNFESSKKISLIFRPEVPKHQIVFKDNKRFLVKNKENMLSGGYLYITRKSKKILKKPKNGFNKYIELNNYIPRGGFGIYGPQWTLVAYKEAIKRGYKMVDADILFTKDKIPVIAHDRDLTIASNGKGDLTKKTLNELEQLDFGIKFDKKYAGEKILKLDELLKLCKENDIIIDLDLRHLNYPEFLNNRYDYIKILINHIENYNMINSIVFNDIRQSILDVVSSIRKDISFSINGMNRKKNIERIKSKYKDSKILIYNMGLLQSGRTINEKAVKYGISLGRKIKASKIDDINFANKVIKWGVNFICTNKLQPFLMKNEKEEPIKIKCNHYDFKENISICEINENISLIDNEFYKIYYSINKNELSEDIVEESIGEFQYVNTNLSNQLYYKINFFNFQKGIIRLTTSNLVKLNEKITGFIKPDYDNVAKCYYYEYICKGNGRYDLNCIIKKNDPETIKFNGKYAIYTLEGYSFNPIEVINRFNYSKIKKKQIKLNINIIIMIFIIFLIMYSKIIKNNSYLYFNKNNVNNKF